MASRSDQRAGSEASAFHRDGSSQPLLTAEDVARLLGVTRSWVYEQSRLGRIPTVTLGRYRRYRREAIDAWVDELEDGAPSGRLVRGGNGFRDRIAS